MLRVDPERGLRAVEGSRNLGFFSELAGALTHKGNTGKITSGQKAIMEDYRIGPKMVIVAVPTSSTSAYGRISSLVDHLVCPDVSRLPIFAVANTSRDWGDLEDEEIEDFPESHVLIFTSSCSKRTAYRYVELHR